MDPRQHFKLLENALATQTRVLELAQSLDRFRVDAEKISLDIQSTHNACGHGANACCSSNASKAPAVKVSPMKAPDKGCSSPVKGAQNKGNNEGAKDSPKGKKQESAKDSAKGGKESAKQPAKDNEVPAEDSTKEDKKGQKGKNQGGGGKNTNVKKVDEQGNQRSKQTQTEEVIVEEPWN